MRLSLILVTLMILVAAPPAIACPFIPQVYNPVCGVNGVTYKNASDANCNFVVVAYQGKCRPTSRPTSKPTSQPSSRPTSRPTTKPTSKPVVTMAPVTKLPPWKPHFPKKHTNPKTCMRDTVKWSKHVASMVSMYLHRAYYKKRFGNSFMVPLYDGVPRGKLWLNWIKNNPKKRWAIFMIFNTYKLSTTPEPQDMAYLKNVIQGAAYFCR